MKPLEEETIESSTLQAGVDPVNPETKSQAGLILMLAGEQFWCDWDKFLQDVAFQGRHLNNFKK